MDEAIQELIKAYVKSPNAPYPMDVRVAMERLIEEYLES